MIRIFTRSLLLGLLALAAAIPAYAQAPTFDVDSDFQGNSAGATGTSSESCSITPTGTAAVVVAVGTISSSRTFDTPTSSGLTFTDIASVTSGGGSGSRHLHMWVAPNVSASSHTITVNVTGGLLAQFWVECISLTGAHTTTPLSVNNGGYEDTNSTSATDGHVCSASATAYGSDTYTVAVGLLTAWSNTLTAGTVDGGWTKLDDQDTTSAGAGSWELIAQGIRKNGSSLTSQANWTSDVARSSICVAASFVGSGGGGGGSTTTPNGLSLLGAGH